VTEPTPSFNPARFNDLIDEGRFARLWGGPGAQLKRERKDRIEWLRKKYKNDPASLALADKLEGCKTDTRCKSAACPECAYARPRTRHRGHVKVFAKASKRRHDRLPEHRAG
jgi:hypothetical protein